MIKLVRLMLLKLLQLEIKVIKELLVFGKNLTSRKMVKARLLAHIISRNCQPKLQMELSI